MTTVTVRRQHGAAIVTLPAEMLEMLNIEVGSKLDFEVSDGVLKARPPGCKKQALSDSRILARPGWRCVLTGSF